MRPSDVHPSDDLARYAEEHLPLVLEVLVRLTDAPALAFDMATETIATARRFARDEGRAPSPVDPLRHVAEAMEHVFHATFEHGRVPHRERSRDREPVRWTLSSPDLAAIKALAREPVTAGSFCERLLHVLNREQPSPLAIGTVALSPLVAGPSSDREHRA